MGVPREEEKKGDRDTLPIVRDDHDKVRRRNRTFNSWVKPSRHLSTSSAFVEYGKTFFLPTLAVFSLVYCAFFEPGNVRPTGINGLEIAMGGAGSRDVVLPGAFESTEKGFYAPYYDYTFDLLTDDDNFMRNIAYTGYEEIFGRDTFEDEKNLKRYKYAFDDDEKRNPYRGWGVHNKNHLERKNHCRQTALRKETFFSTCNDFHSLGFDSFVSKARAFYIGGGSFRDVFRLNEANGDPYVILKTASYSGVKYRPHNFELYRMDTSVANALSPHPLVVDIYGSCALAMFSEVMPRGDVDVVSVPKYHRSRCDETDINGQDHLVKMNDINPTTKLIWALQMAESVALLHNHPKGVIVHDDVQTLQWLIADDGHIKMNDFNRAEVGRSDWLPNQCFTLPPSHTDLNHKFMLYDEEHGMYCRYKNGPGPGDVSVWWHVSNVANLWIVLILIIWAHSPCSEYSSGPQRSTKMSHWTNRSTSSVSVIIS